MADQQTSIRPASGAGEPSLDEVLSAILALTSDAVLAFDSRGIIRLANDEASRLLAPQRVAPTGMVGTDVRALFPLAVGQGFPAPFSLSDLPLPTDGSTAHVTCSDASGRSIALRVRCTPIGAVGETFLLMAHPDPGQAAASYEHERLVEELSRANRRLSGTLDVVLGTLDSPSVSTLFERVLEKLRETMDALGTTVYLAERDGFHLRGTSASLAQAKVPRYLPAQGSFARMVLQAEHALRLHVLPPEGESLRKGHLRYREVADDESHKTHRMRASQLPPFMSFMVVPVRFGGRVIAVIQVGWRGSRVIPRDDADLLDAVCRYLAVQLVGAFAALQSQRRDQLSARAASLRDAVAAEPFSESTRQQVFDAVEHDLYCICAQLDGPSAINGHEVVHLPLSHEEVAIPSGLLAQADDGGVTEIPVGSDLSKWLYERDEPCLGALVACGASTEAPMRFLALRSADAEPLDDLELEYLRQVSDTVGAVLSGNRGRQRDHRISQALQTGMRSQLQQVEGISSQGIYSSATEAAFVGGDFYDLIRLPQHRACVIMGDVSGKGVEAASVSAAVRTALGAYSWEGLEPAHMVDLLNEFLLGFARIETFATLFVGIVDLSAATLTYCSAGHPPAILIRKEQGSLEWLGVQSGVVGAFHDMTYRNGQVRLTQGDVLLLYTDGTTEARARDGRFFGEEGLRDAVMREQANSFDGLLDRLLAQVDAFTGNSLDDDVAMVALRFDELHQEG